MPHCVKLALVPSITIECKFWLEDSEWHGIAAGLSIVVHAGSFEEPKHEMEAALGRHIESVLLQAGTKATGHAG